MAEFNATGRKYSVEEIDKMRMDIATLESHQKEIVLDTASFRIIHPLPRRDTSIDEILRTYMIGGVEPAALAAKALAAKEEADRERRESERYFDAHDPIMQSYHLRELFGLPNPYPLSVMRSMRICMMSSTSGKKVIWV